MPYLKFTTAAVDGPDEYRISVTDLENFSAPTGNYPVGKYVVVEQDSLMLLYRAALPNLNGLASYTKRNKELEDYIRSLEETIVELKSDLSDTDRKSDITLVPTHKVDRSAHTREMVFHAVAQRDNVAAYEVSDVINTLEALTQWLLKGSTDGGATEGQGQAERLGDAAPACEGPRPYVDTSVSSHDVGRSGQGLTG